MSKKDKLMSEELKRFNLLKEYDFYIGEDKEEFVPDGDLITEEPPEDEAPEGELPDTDLEDAEATEMGGDEDLPVDDLEGGEEAPMDDLEGGEEPLPEPEPMDEPLPEPEPMEDEVELDVTELVQGTQAAKDSADQANMQITSLLSKFEELNASLDKMDAINAKIDSLEHEVEQRNPTPEEQLEMRSLDSFPYNLKLTDYWNEKEGNYDAMNGGKKDEEKEELVLTQDEVDRDYNSIEVKDSFQDTTKQDEFDEDIVY
jgi:outer membrane murein-binding lipoprotein Lpp